MLSIGLSCRKGFSLIGLSGLAPCLATPQGILVPFDVKGDIPFLKEGGLHAQRGTTKELMAFCGVRARRGQRIRVNHSVDARISHAAGGEEATGDADSPESDGGSEQGREPEGEADDSDVDNPIRRSLRSYARSLDHLLTHKPAMPKDCEACMRGKTTHKRKMHGRPARNPQDFGDLVTIDHVYVRDWHGRAGLGGFVDSFTVLDVATGCKCSEPVDALDALETARALQHIRGDDGIHRLYSYN